MRVDRNLFSPSDNNRFSKETVCVNFFASYGKMNDFLLPIIIYNDILLYCKLSKKFKFYRIGIKRGGLKTGLTY